MLVKVRVGGWGVHYVNEDPHMDSNVVCSTSMSLYCLYLCVLMSLYYCRQCFNKASIGCSKADL